MQVNPELNGSFIPGTSSNVDLTVPVGETTVNNHCGHLYYSFIILFHLVFPSLY